MISQKTAEQLLTVISRHINSQEKVRELVKDLLQVKGNKSFEQSVKALWEIVK